VNLLHGVLLALLMLISACSSRPPAADRLPAKAQQHFQQGMRLVAAQPAAALTHFEAAHRLAPGRPSLLLNMGLAHRQLNQHGAAAGWLNAWLATPTSSPQRADIELAYRHEQVEASKQALPALRNATHLALLQLQAAPASGDTLITPLAVSMAAGGDLYGGLRLLSESEKLLQEQGIQAGWLPAARDRVWEAQALILILARQIPAAERAWRNLHPGPRQEQFWNRLATHPATVYQEFPELNGLASQPNWIIPLAAPYTVSYRYLPSDAATRYSREPLAVRARQLAETLTAAQTALSTAAPERQGQAATRFNALLFLMEASAAERHTASP
jgi:hypothetical protein